jgi:hypothetical protein
MNSTIIDKEKKAKAYRMLINLEAKNEERKQPLNEAYKNEVLEAYQKISDTFDDFTQLMRKRIPYEEWPSHCKIEGIDPDLLGTANPSESHIKRNFKMSDILEVPVPPLTSLPSSEKSSNQVIDRMISRIKDLGRVRERMKMILDYELFENLSKHNSYFHSENELESEKLDDLRRKISYLNNSLWDIMTILRTDDEE